jgi:glycosyltransferase involved in cell wall biosynthesis
MQQGLVSILVNNHNYGAYVVDAVQSALDQTYPHIEVIVIDDGSTDDSMARLAEISDPRLLVATGKRAVHSVSRFG